MAEQHHIMSDRYPQSATVVERATLSCRLHQLDEQLNGLVDMGRALAGPFGKEDTKQDEPVRTVVEELHHTLDSICCKIALLEGQLKTLTNDL